MPQAIFSQGASLSRNGNIIAALNSVGGISLDVDVIDATTHQSAGGFEEVIAGLIKTGEIPIEANFDPTDTNGQQGLLTDLMARTLQSFAINLPSGITWTFNAIVTKFSTDDAPVNGKLGMKASLKPSGQPTLTVTNSAGLTTPFLALSGSGTLVPAAAQAITEYVYNVATGVSSVTITPTASAGVITITANGASQTVATGVASTAITLGAAGSITTVVMTVKETNKTAKTYTIKIVRA